MTDKEELTLGDALARVDVLEAEVAELRKRVCVPDVSTMARALSDRAASAYCVDPDDNWKIYGQEFIEDVQAMLAAPAPVERLATDGGRNQRFEGLFEGETPDQRDARLASAAPVERVETDKRIDMWGRIHDLAVSKGYDHVLYAVECAPVYKCDCMGARKVALDLDGNTMPCECVTAANDTTPQPSPAPAAPDVAGLVEALRRLERASDRRAALMSGEAYRMCSLIPGMDNALLELDSARKQARELLAAHQSGGAK